MLAIREECLCKPQPQLRGLSEKSCSIFSRCYSGSPELHGSYGTRNLWIIASNFCLFSALVVTLTAKEEGNSTVWIEIWNHRLNFRFFFFFKVTFSVVKTMIFFFLQENIFVPDFWTSVTHNGISRSNADHKTTLHILSSFLTHYLLAAKPDVMV